MNAVKHNTGRLRRFCKWAGLALTLSLAVIWVGSGWYAAAYTDSRRDTWLVAYGLVGTGWGGHAPAPDQEPTWDFRPTKEHRGLLNWKPACHVYKLNGSRAVTLYVPLWMIVLVSGLCTAFVWRRDYVIGLKLKSGVCPHCAFNLSGLAPEAVCPECGKLRALT